MWPTEEREQILALISASGTVRVLGYLTTLKPAKTDSAHRHKNNKKKLFLAVYIICIMNIPFRKSPRTSVLGGEDSCYLVAEDRHSKNTLQ